MVPRARQKGRRGSCRGEVVRVRRPEAIRADLAGLVSWCRKARRACAARRGPAVAEVRGDRREAVVPAAKREARCSSTTPSSGVPDRNPAGRAEDRGATLRATAAFATVPAAAIESARRGPHEPARGEQTTDSRSREHAVLRAPVPLVREAARRGGRLSGREPAGRARSSSPPTDDRRCATHPSRSRDRSRPQGGASVVNAHAAADRSSSTKSFGGSAGRAGTPGGGGGGGGSGAGRRRRARAASEWRERGSAAGAAESMVLTKPALDRIAVFEPCTM